MPQPMTKSPILDETTTTPKENFHNQDKPKINHFTISYKR
jgi:hypothetical protein